MRVSQEEGEGWRQQCRGCCSADGCGGWAAAAAAAAAAAEVALLLLLLPLAAVGAAWLVRARGRGRCVLLRCCCLWALPLRSVAGSRMKRTWGPAARQVCACVCVCMLCMMWRQAVEALAMAVQQQQQQQQRQQKEGLSSP